MDSDQECQLTVEEKSFQIEDKKEEKKFLPDKYITLKKREEFLFIRKNGKSSKSKHFIINFFYRSDALSRIGLTVSKKLGNSVNRNYIKRIIRSILRDKDFSLPKGFEIEIIPMKHAKNSKYTDLKVDLDNLLKKLKI